MIPFQDLARFPIDLKPAVDRVIYSGAYLRGEETRRFEEEWAEYCGQQFCVACANGTDAITLAALGLRRTTATVPATTVWYTAEGLHRAGCRINIVDVDLEGCLVSNSADAVPVPLYGRDPSAIELTATFFDAAHAHGWKPPVSATVAWSFYPTKNLGALGDAGAITTNDKSLADEMRMLAGRDDLYCSSRQIVSRVDEIQAAVLRDKLKRLDEMLSFRRQIAEWYWRYLPSFVTPVLKPSEGRFHLFVIRLQERDELKNFLLDNGVGCKVHYATPLHKYKTSPWEQDLSLPNSEEWCKTVLSLPCFPGLTVDEVKHVCSTISRFAMER